MTSGALSFKQARHKILGSTLNVSILHYPWSSVLRPCVVAVLIIIFDLLSLVICCG